MFRNSSLAPTAVSSQVRETDRAMIRKSKWSVRTRRTVLRCVVIIMVVVVVCSLFLIEKTAVHDHFVRSSMISAQMEVASDSIMTHVLNPFLGCRVTSPPRFFYTQANHETSCHVDVCRVRMILVWETYGCTNKIHHVVRDENNRDVSCTITSFATTTRSKIHQCQIDMNACATFGDFRYNVLGYYFEEQTEHFAYEKVAVVDRKSVSPASESVSTTVAVVGDSQAGASVFREVLRELSTLNPVALVHLGDVVQDDRSASEWHTKFLGPLAQHLNVPVLLTRGNHDVNMWNRMQKGDVSLSSSPMNILSPHGWFGVTIGAVRFLVLDSVTGTSLDPAQMAWLTCELKSRPFLSATFRVAVTHIPPFVEYWDSDAWFGEKQESQWGIWSRTTFSTLLEQHGVELIMSGHSHLYQRGSRIVQNASSPFHGSRTHYVITGGGGGTLERPGENSARVVNWGNMYNVTHFGHHFVTLRTEKRPSESTPSMLIIDAYRPNGVVIDSFVIEGRKRWVVVN